jgi:pimeloyl-ACP methyl ester carboxylesterase
MLYNAQNKNMQIGDTDFDYAVFGSGKKKLILIAGLGDGLRTMKGLALPIAILYKDFAKDYTVYMFSRRNKMEDGFTTRDMAKDIIYAMHELNIDKADVVGVSQGGMIAQWMAIDHPEKVNALVLVVTAIQNSEMIENNILRWKQMALDNDHIALMKDNVINMYSEAYAKKNAWATYISGLLTKPKNYDRFLVMADACLTHDTTQYLDRIQSRTLIIAGAKDVTVGVKDSYLLKDKIENSELLVYPQWGHALYEEEKSFNRVVLQFLKEKNR